MNTSKLSKFALTIVLGGAAFAFAADEAKHDAPAKTDSTKSTPKEEKSDAKSSKLTKPWDDIDSLTPDQKEKIGDLHHKAIEEIKAIQKKEHDDIMALLTDAQKTELKAAQDKEAAEKKAARAEKKAEKGSEKGSKKGDEKDDAGAK